MDITTLITGLLVGLVVGGLLAWLAVRAEVAGLRAERDGLREQLEGLRERLDEQAHAADEDDRTAAALAPLGETLRRVSAKVEQLERDRVSQFASVSEALSRVEDTTTRVGREASSLASSLRVSSVRGAWGEVQLRRVLEVSGMIARCDFDEQTRGATAAEREVRPDVVVHLPGGKHLVVDAKAPMSHWLQAQAEEIDPSEHDRLLEAHAASLRAHVTTLSSKAYWTAFEPSPEMVVCFVPSDATLAAALSRAPGLHEEAMAERVVLASPGTLLALLRTVAYAWQQDAVTRDAQELLTVGRELYARLGTLGEHATRMGRSLQRSVEDYNRLVGSLESRVLVSARRMGEIGLSSEEIDEVPAVTTTPRPLTSPELLDVVADHRPELDLDLGLPHPREQAADPREQVARSRAQEEGGRTTSREEAS